MNKPTNKVSVERWTISAPKSALFPSGKQTVAKVTVRVAKGKPGAGQFHGATNFKGSVL